jgi:hypothetical protein
VKEAKERIFESSAMQIVERRTCEGINCMRCPLMDQSPSGECKDGGGERDHSQAAADWLIDYQRNYQPTKQI